MAEMSQASASTQATADARPIFEVGFHLLPSIPEGGLGAAVEKIRALLGGAEIISQGAPERMTLAYTIERAAQGKREKFTQSYFGWIKFALPEESKEEASVIPALQESLRNLNDMMRYIVIKTVREEFKAPRRAVFGSDRLEGETIKKPVAASEKPVEVSQEELDKSIDALTS